MFALMHRKNPYSRLTVTCLVPLLLGGMFSPGILRAEIRLPAVIGSHMVIQQSRPVILWGWAEAGETVSVRFLGKTAETQADANGNGTGDACEAMVEKHCVGVGGKVVSAEG